MEFSNEIKAKVFAQYLGQMIELDNGGSKVRNRKLIAVGGIDDQEYLKLRLGSAEKGFAHAIFIKNDVCKLILKPLLSVTDNEALKIAKLYGVDTLPDTDEPLPVGVIINKGRSIVFCIKGSMDTSFYSIQKIILIYQYLQLEGYDTPQYLLGGKTLKEAGLAIYE